MISLTTRVGKHAREPLIERLVLEHQSFVVEPEQPDYGCMEISNMDRIFGDVAREVISFIINDSRRESATGHPHREASRMKFAAEIAPSSPP